MFMEALVNEDPALAQQALQSITAEAASKKRELIRECWMSRVRLLDSSASSDPSDSSAASDPFVQYLHRTIQTIVPASSHK